MELKLELKFVLQLLSSYLKQIRVTNLILLYFCRRSFVRLDFQSSLSCLVHIYKAKGEKGKMETWILLNYGDLFSNVL